jgi:hypothetical protein
MRLAWIVDQYAPLQRWMPYHQWLVLENPRSTMHQHRLCMVSSVQPTVGTASTVSLLLD